MSKVHLLTPLACVLLVRSYAEAFAPDAWCPHLSARAPRRPEGVKCDPAGRRWLFILGTGRSGSTTLLNQINGLGPLFYLGGENYNMLHYAKEEWDQVKMIPHFSDGVEEATTAFQHGQIRADDFICDIQDLFLDIAPYPTNIRFTPHPKGSVRGFKEIRDFSDEDREAFDVFFPCSRIILNFRKDMAAQTRSAFYVKFGGDVLETVQNYTQQLLKWHHVWGPQRTFLMPLEEFSVRKFEELREWLGVTGCRYTRVREDHKAGKRFVTANNVTRVAYVGEYYAERSGEPVVEGTCELP